MSDEKLEKELENDLKILALDCYDKGFNAGLKAEREKSKKLVEVLRIYTKIGGFSGPAIKALEEYEKEGE